MTCATTILTRTEVAGIMQGGSVSWQVGRQRGLGL